MSLLIRKPEKRTVIAISVPISTKRLWDEISKQAELQDYDLTGSMSKALQNLIQQAKGELERYAAIRENGKVPLE